MGLSAPPPERIPVESLSDKELVEQAIADRIERARSEKMELRSIDSNKLWTDYTITNSASGKTYRVALRGWERGDSYCSCPDFRKNTLGTCKHILHALEKIKKRFNKTVKNTPYEVKDICIHIQYGEELELRVLVPKDLDTETMELLRPVTNKSIKQGMLPTPSILRYRPFPKLQRYCLLYQDTLQNNQYRAQRSWVKPLCRPGSQP